MSDSIADMFKRSREISDKSRGPNRFGMNTRNIFANLGNGANRVRLGGAFVMCSRHFIKDLVDQNRLRGANADMNDQRVRFGNIITCLNWDIDHSQQADESSRCCPLCDLRAAARQVERTLRNTKSVGNAEEDKKRDESVKQYQALSGNAMPRMRYLWPSILRSDPNVVLVKEDGSEEPIPGWKVLSLGTEANKAIESLYQSYPQLVDVEQGCDIDIFKTMSARITYSASYALDGAKIAVTPLKEHERQMEQLNLKRFIPNYVSPRELFLALKERYRTIIKEVFHKSAEDYPEQSVLKREETKNVVDAAEGDEEEGTTRHRSAVTPQVKRQPANVADEFADVAGAPVPPPPPTSRPASPPPSVSRPVIPTPPPPTTARSVPPPPPPASSTPVKNDPQVRPSCFKTCDVNDNECKRCKLIDECNVATPKA
jgi:hypothetical protein